LPKNNVNNKILSICIPTYNRAHYLKQCLDNIILQFDDETIKNSVEIIISDNASTDTTQELGKNYQSRFSNIKYFRNEKNIGLDENIINSVLRAKGKYCWHIGDDDLIQNGTLDLIIKILTKKEVALLTVNFYPFIDINKSSEKKTFAGDYSAEYVNSAEEFYNKGFCQGILGIFILNKEPWLKIDRKNYEEFWSYYEIILKMIGLSKMPVAYLNYPLLFTGQDYRWNKNGAAFFCAIYIRRVLNKLRDFGWSKKFIDGELNTFAKALPRALIKGKASGLKCSFANLRLICKELYKYPLRMLLVVLIFFIPNSFFKTLKSIKKQIKIN